MERREAFVAYPLSMFGIQPSSHVCRRHSRPQCRLQRSPRTVCMVTEEYGNDRQMPLENLMTEDSQFLGIPELIVDVAGDDIDDDNIVDVLGADFDLQAEKRKKVRKRTGDFVDEINLQPDTILTHDADRQPPIDKDETTKYVRTAVLSADMRKADDIVAIRISKLTYIASFVVIATGKNTPQIRAIGNTVEDDMAKTHGLHVRRRDGTANSGWLLLDYGDFMVNVFSPEQRANYNLEGLWKHGEEVDISDCKSGPEEKSITEEATNDSLDDWLN